MTQYASQLERTRTGKTIVEAVPTQVLLPNIRASATDYAMLGLSEKELDVLLGVGSASRLALVRDDRGAVVIDADLRDAREAANALVRDAEQAAHDNADNL